MQQKKNIQRLFLQPTYLQVYLKYNRMAINFIRQIYEKGVCIKTGQFLYQK